MKSCLICESGLIGMDGKLRIPMDRLEQFFREHLGERAIVKVQALERHSSPAMLGYYFGYVLPTLRKAYAERGELLTEKMVHEKLWWAYPGEHDPVQEIREAPYSQVYNFIEWLKQYAAENLDCYIEDPMTI